MDFGSNDDRSDSLDPNSAKHATSRDNHSDQLNPNNRRPIHDERTAVAEPGDFSALIATPNDRR